MQNRQKNQARKQLEGLSLSLVGFVTVCAIATLIMWRSDWLPSFDLRPHRVAVETNPGAGEELKLQAKAPVVVPKVSPKRIVREPRRVVVAEPPQITTNSVDETVNDLSSVFDDLGAGNFEAAKLKLEAIIAANPNNFDAKLELAHLYLDRFDDPGKAQNILENLAMQRPDEIVLSDLVGIYMQTDQIETGLNFLHRVADEGGDQASEAQYAIGDLLAMNGNSNAAVPYFEKTAAARPGAPEPLVSLASAYIDSGLPQKAVGALEKALPLERQLAEERLADGVPQDIAMELYYRTKLRLAEAYIEQGDLESARSEFEEAAGALPDDHHQVASIRRRLDRG